MPNANYKKGYAAELNIVRELRNLGYESQRSAASHGIFDVYGLREQDCIFIQSKRGGKPSPKEYEKAVLFPVPEGVFKLVLWFPDGLQTPRVLYYNRLPPWLGNLATGTAPQVRWSVEDLPKQQALVEVKGEGLRLPPAPRRRTRKPLESQVESFSFE